MRIVAGAWRGREIIAPQGVSTRPTSDRVREALFSSIEARFGALAGTRVLDAFAGSGALALEALSRGAEHATLVDDDRKAATAIRRNITTLGANAMYIQADITRESTMGRLSGVYSLLLLDPPYRIDKSKVRALIERLHLGERVVAGTMVVWEHQAGEEPDWPDFVEPVVARTYGSTATDIGVIRSETEGR